MTPDPLDTLLEQLSRGDPVAAEQVFLEYEPYLRKVVRRQLTPRLRVKFDSIDVVQSVWADVLKGFREAGWQFSDAEHLRAFLVTITRNRFIDRYRRNRGALDRERPLVPTSGAPDAVSQQPRPSEIAQAEELWDQLLKICPPDHHEILRLKRDGYSLREIADRTGLHEGSVRRILRNLAREIALRQRPIPTKPDDD